LEDFSASGLWVLFRGVAGADIEIYCSFVLFHLKTDKKEVILSPYFALIMSIGGEKDFTTARLKKVKFYFLTEKKGAGYSDHPVDQMV